MTLFYRKEEFFIIKPVLGTFPTKSLSPVIGKRNYI